MDLFLLYLWKIFLCNYVFLTISVFDHFIYSKNYKEKQKKNAINISKFKLNMINGVLKFINHRYYIQPVMSYILVLQLFLFHLHYISPNS
ncbi:hypothetical protein PFUGPA_01680 [Plasmodium falciparum Palo Alto/Uganda]|uniref:Uncharacterized protein n=3 Tax=Plasmodium falciparum TaxID=5833 RepID=W4J274_PLAFP|nr:hypothetical protein PFFVO_03227 [Plasmodium falciparum Vietnam Oak-Knoll (FVO)]ETW56315.1 hypothetical protein PFUGPA_01680 [Plasmodium falciparum Palo Alto/Uganda]EUR69643.1 hypothetical protein PFBG_03667 [Plasmodium falciparum 7G8]